MQKPYLFDSHLHIIDDNYPLVENQGYLPPTFNCADYLSATRAYKHLGGAIVSGSFQAFDQSYLVHALTVLGPRFVGVTQLPYHCPDEQILRLHKAGVRAVRFNLKRGGSEDVKHIEYFAKRVYELAAWHVELYADSSTLDDLIPCLMSLPKVSIDHLGLSKAGLPHLLKLAENNIHIKATGFSRVDFNVGDALKRIYEINPNMLMFGTDLPSTRAPITYQHTDYELVEATLGKIQAQDVYYKNALAFYGITANGGY